jgi:hypothetical protein
MIDALILCAIVYILGMLIVPMGAYLRQRKKVLSRYLMLVSGAGISFLSFWVVKFFRDDPVYHWYYLVGVIFVLSLHYISAKYTKPDELLFRAHLAFNASCTLTSIVLLILY